MHIQKRWRGFISAFIFAMFAWGQAPLHAHTIELTGTIRDFSDSHSDFEDSICGHITGLVASTLGSDGKPTFGPNGLSCISSASTFSEWYNDVSDVILKTNYTITLNNGTTTSGGSVYLR